MVDVPALDAPVINVVAGMIFGIRFSSLRALDA